MTQTTPRARYFRSAQAWRAWLARHHADRMVDSEKAERLLRSQRRS